jgi:hypothetical protein
MIRIIAFFPPIIFLSQLASYHSGRDYEHMLEREERQRVSTEEWRWGTYIRGLEGSCG